MTVIESVDLPPEAQNAPFVPPAIAPDPRAKGLFGLMRAMVNDPLSTIPPAAYQEPVTVVTVAGHKSGFICDPAMLEVILVKRVQDFPKSRVDERVFRPAFGDSLLITHGEDWRWKRRLAAPHFSPAALAKYLPAMTVPFEALAGAWRARNDTGAIDVSTAMTQATLEVINCTLFTNREELDAERVSEAISDYLAPISWSIGLASLKAPAWLPHPGKSRIKRGQRNMRAVVGELIAARRKTPRPRSDICADLMAARDPETDRPLSDSDLVDMLLTLVAAGHDTSANGLTWALYCLAAQPAVQEDLCAEIRRVTGGRTPDTAHIPELSMVEAFLKETMRLFPPAPFLARQTTQAESFGGQAFPAGATLFIPSYAIHRHALLWTSPESFDLTRFLGDKAKKISRTAYMPFGAGPRICIGGTFAMMEMVAALAVLLARVRFSITDATRCEPMQRITLRPKRSLELAVAPV